MGGVKRMKKGETLKKNCPKKSARKSPVGQHWRKWMTIMQGMLDLIECALDEILCYLVRRNFSGHINEDVSFVKRIDHLSNCQLSEDFDVPAVYTI